MKELLEHYENDLNEFILRNIDNISNIEKIRINMSAVFKCEYNEIECILKYSVVGEKNNQDFSDYSMIHARKILGWSEFFAFPNIYYSEFYEYQNYTFFITIEEKFPNSFSDGIVKLYEDCDEDIIKCSSKFLISLLNIYISGRQRGFISHRDLSFDNLMFDEEYNLKMIDLGSAKSLGAETTAFHITAPTKLFYSAPEYNELHKKNTKDELELVRAEIYTIGLLTLSLMNALKDELFTKKCFLKCGIIEWLTKNSRQFHTGEQLKEAFKQDYTKFLLLDSDIFNGNEKNMLYRLVKGMTDSSVSSRISDYSLITKNLEKEMV